MESRKTGRMAGTETVRGVRRITQDGMLKPWKINRLAPVASCC